MSERDKLTGLLNRRTLEDRLRHTFAINPSTGRESLTLDRDVLILTILKRSMITSDT
ncbi:hypothetical protein WI845_02700 [Vibrio cholerae]